jgi:hypothetical protein
VTVVSGGSDFQNSTVVVDYRELPVLVSDIFTISVMEKRIAYKSYICYTYNIVSANISKIETFFEPFFPIFRLVVKLVADIFSIQFKHYL